VHVVEEPRDSGQIRELFDRFAVTANRGDLAEWSQVWEEEAKYFAPQTPPLVGRSDIIFGNRKWLSQWQHDPQIDCDEIQIAGKWAFVCGRITLRSTHRKTGATTYTDGKFLAVAKRRSKHQWGLYRFCYNSNVPPIGPYG